MASRWRIVAATAMAVLAAGACTSGVKTQSGGASGSGDSGSGTGAQSSGAGQGGAHSSAQGAGGAQASSGAQTGTSAQSSSAAQSGSSSASGGGMECTTNADCKTFSYQCSDNPCTCLALPKAAPDPVCVGPMVACVTDPCTGHAATCLNGYCTLDGGKQGTSCKKDQQCQSGLKCCYPCGMPGCSNQCIPPGPNKMCPMFP